MILVKVQFVLPKKNVIFWTVAMNLQSSCCNHNILAESTKLSIMNKSKVYGSFYSNAGNVLRIPLSFRDSLSRAFFSLDKIMKMRI